MRLEGKTAIVTGGGKGIGKSIALSLAREGCSVAVAGRTSSYLDEVAREINELGRDALAIVCDVANPQSVERLFEQLRQHWDSLDILVNNAGQNHSELLVRLDLDTWRRMLDINLTGTFLCSQAALRWMLQRRSGRIINIASIGAQIGIRYAGAYVAAKHGVLGLTRTMALEVAMSDITVNAICPGWVESDMVQGVIQTISAKTNVSPGQAREHLAKESPQQRLIRPEEIAFVTVWLSSDEARGITGQAINVSGGQVMK